jgi:hypothetical protein
MEVKLDIQIAIKIITLQAINTTAVLLFQVKKAD